MKYIVVIDEGTSSTRATVYDENANAVCMRQKGLNFQYPQPGWVECSAVEIWESTREVLYDAVTSSGVPLKDILSIGMTAQRESVVVWDRATGEPVYNCIIWLDRRTNACCQELNKDLKNAENLHNKSGQFITSFFPPTKVSWILDNVPGMRERAEKGELCFGTVDTWLFYNMTGKKRHVAEMSNAARTLFFNIHTLEWDDELIDIFGVPKSMLPPEILPSDGCFGDLTGVFDRDIPIMGSLGDQQAALFGHQCFETGQTKATLGTAGLVSMNTGKEPMIHPAQGATLGWNCKLGKAYALEGGFYFCGGIFEWLQKQMRFIENPAQSADVAFSVDDTMGVYFSTTFFGATASVVNDFARGTIVGLNVSADTRHIVRAALESIGYQVRAVASGMTRAAQDANRNMQLTSISIDGGVSKNKFVMQFITDMLDVPVGACEDTEATSLGALYMSGVANGLWKSFDDLRKLYRPTRVYEPVFSKEKRQELMERWNIATEATLLWGDRMAKRQEQG